jgi:hypothetical protein
MRSRPRSCRERGSCRNRPALVLLLALAATGVAGSAVAQDGEPTGIEIQGIASAGYTHSFQRTDLPSGGSISDGNGIDVLAGIQTGEYLAFQLGAQWQGESDFDTYYFPVMVRAMSPVVLERVRMYGQAGLGLFFSSLHNEFNGNENERGAMYSLGGGFEVGIDDGFSAIVYAAYQKGLGSTNDYESRILGVGLQYRWGL